MTKIPLKARFQQLLVNVFMYVIPAVIAIWRHAQVNIESKRGMLGLVIVAVIFYNYAKKKNKYYRIKETKEIEDDKRTTKTIIYFYTKFAIMYVVLFLGLYYIQFNFKSLTATMQMIGGSLVVGALLRLDLAKRYHI